MEETITKAQLKAMCNFKIYPVTNMNLRELSSVKIPEAAVSFDASNNALTDFTGFACTDNIKGVSFDNNPLISFKGFPQDTKITSFSAKGSPLSTLPNFKQLVLLAVGTSVDFINGERVSNREKSSVSPQALAIYYYGSANKMQNSEKQTIVNGIADLLRSGWISDRLPILAERSYPVLFKVDARAYENDPVTVRAIRIGDILKWSVNEKQQFISNLLNETKEEKKYIVNSKSEDISAKIQRQKKLVAILEQELKDLEENSQSKEREREKQTKEESKREVSHQTMDMYFEMLQKHASDLIDNTQIVESSKSIDPEGIREVVRKFLNKSEKATDDELISGLEQAAETQ
jgi:hypothetical protein